jgi:hypothetical protein
MALTKLRYSNNIDMKLNVLTHSLTSVRQFLKRLQVSGQGFETLQDKRKLSKDGREI